jgi:hypothetical protein
MARAASLLLEHGDGRLVPIDYSPLTKFFRFGGNDLGRPEQIHEARLKRCFQHMTKSDV